jgi:hypothetical protein
MAEGEHFEVGTPLRVMLSHGRVSEGVVTEIEVNSRLWPDKTVLHALWWNEIEQCWKRTWWWAEDHDVHPHPQPEWGQAQWAACMLLERDAPLELLPPLTYA